MTGDAGDDADEGWRPWNGGAAPVAADRLVEVRRRYAPGTLVAPAGALTWSHDQYVQYGADDIVAFRPARPRVSPG